MSKKPQKPGDSDPEGFGLKPPSEAASRFRPDERPQFANESVVPDSAGQGSEDEFKFKQMGWKGIDVEEEDYEPEFKLVKEPIPEDELDMTPMVDVTFLLLIFFMVTASFTLQKSIKQPPAQSDAPSVNVEDLDIVDDYIEVIIDQTNTYYVTSRQEEEVEAPSEREMRSQLQLAKENSNATRMIIRAHVDSMHRKVVTAWDAGITVGMDKIEIQTTEEDF